MSIRRSLASRLIALVGRLPPSVVAALVERRRLPLPFDRADLEVVLAMVDEIERLPTVRRGLSALSMRSMLEWGLFDEEISREPSPYVDPWQRPYLFHPGVRARAFHPNEEFPWIPTLEREAPAIRRALDAALGARRGFQPYRLIETGGTLEGWNMLSLHSAGRRVPRAEDGFDPTMAVLEGVPRFRSLGISCVSGLVPGTHIRPHHGPINGVLRVHLCLSGAAGATLRVGAEHRKYVDGHAFVFDDSFEHEVRHGGTDTRFVLFFDVWHPDWTDDEVRRLERLHAALGGTRYLRDVDAGRRRDRDELTGRKWW
jgi:aspartyl/asparaginyl beta-hydroxylase (cupin superfamily)